jgi:cytochrome bd-type quinol oxidase subunit 2
MNAEVDAERGRARRFAWSSLLVWALFGLALEAAHGFKVSAYLDDGLRRSLLRLAHAHGVILALVVLAYGEAGAPLHASPDKARRVGRLFRAGAILIPVGFALSAVRASEGDPSPPILLVPLGALVLIAAVGRTTSAAWSRRNRPDGPGKRRAGEGEAGG